jgi:hypothetical protein
MAHALLTTGAVDQPLPSITAEVSAWVADLADPANLVSASSTLAIQGTGEIRAPVTSLSRALAPLPQAFVSAARFRVGTSSRVVLTGRGGLPADRSGVLPSPVMLDDRLAVASAAPQQQLTSTLALLAMDDKVLPRMRMGHANGSLQTAADLGCSTPLGERKERLKRSK